MSNEPVAWIHKKHYLLGHAENMPPPDKALASGWEPLYTRPVDDTALHEAQAEAAALRLRLERIEQQLMRLPKVGSLSGHSVVRYADVMTVLHGRQIESEDDDG